MAEEHSTTVEAVVAEAADQPAPRNIVFAAPADDPRSRRPADLVSLVSALLVLLLAAWAHSARTDIDERVLEFFSGDLPGWLSSTFTIVFIFGGVYALGLLLGVLFFGRGRAAIARDMFLSVLVTLALGAVMSALAGPEWPDILPEVLERDGRPSFPLLRLSATIGLLRVADPYLAVPMRRVGRQVSIAMGAAGIIMSYATVSAIIGAAALGAVSAAIIHLVFGSGVGIPSKSRILADLDSIGVPMPTVDFVPDQPIGVVLLRGPLDDGREAMVKVYGRDAAESAAASRLWRWLFYRDFDRALTASGLQQVEHEGLMLYRARETGVPVADLVGWGKSPTGDAVLVTAPFRRQLLADYSADEVDDSMLDACWSAVQSMRDGLMVHGAIDPHRVVVTDDGVTLRDLSGAAVSPDANALARDVAQMLVTTASVVGTERAIAAARRGIGDEVLEASLPLLQGTALSSTLQADAKAAGIKLKDFRKEVAEAIETEPPELVQLERVTWRNLAMVVLVVFAAYALLSALGDIGFDTIAEQVADAEWSWILIAFILAQLTNVGEWLSLTGVVHNRVPFGPTIMFRYALSFISMAVPSDAGAIAMNIRYMQKLGESTAAAVAQGPLLTVFSKAFDIILLVIASRIIGQTVDLDDIDSGPVLRLLLLVLLALVIGVGVAFGVPKYRRKLVPHIRDGMRSIRAAITSPDRLLRVAAGTLAQKILFAMTLSASVAAYGESLGFGEAIFVNTAISLFVGLIPVPGGVGVGEAALTAGLTAVGIPEEVAVAAAITHRMVTAYIPPVMGFFASRWLTERDYL